MQSVNEYRISRLRDIAITTILCVGIAGPTYTAVADTAATKAADDGDDIEFSLSAGDFADKLLDAGDEAESGPGKSETVYVYADADGSVREVKVSAWLTNPDGARELPDVAALDGIENTEGDEEFTRAGDAIVWQAAGADIYYEGESDAAAPIVLHVSYLLDGAPVSPDELAGRSGRVTIRYDYENTSSANVTVDGQERTVFTPFLCITGLVLDDDVFSNVEAENAKIIADGGRTIVAGFAMPGMRANLGDAADDFDIPEYFEVSADCTDFALGTSATIVTSSLFDDLNADALDGDGDDDLSAVGDAMDALVDGSDELGSGLAQLADGADELSGGVGAFAQQASALPQAAEQLGSGGAALASGVDELGRGLAQMASDDGSVAALAEGAGALNGGLQQTSDALGAILDGADGQPGLSSAAETVGAIDFAVLGQIASSFAEMRDAADAARDHSATAKEQAASAAEHASGAALNASFAAETLAGIDTTGMTPEQASAIAEAASLAAQAADEAAISAQGASDAATSAGTAEAFAQGLSDGIAAANLPDPDALSAQLSGLSEGLAGAAEAIAQVKAGVDQGLIPGSAQLQSGLSALQAGLAGTAGAVQGEMAPGAQALSDGLGQFAQSAPALTQGLDALQTGTSALAQANRAAAEGADALADGLRQFDEKAVQKAIDAYEGDFKDLMTRFAGIIRAGQAYQTFAGKSDAAHGSVKFIYQVDAIE